MGRVWVAEQLALERKVAVKVLSDEAIQSQAALELFYREARATAKVDSPHVVRVLDFDVTEHGWPFLVLELLVGETLEERVQRSGPLPAEDVREIVEQTCSALGAAHDCGILHRDIKAENLFLQRSLGKRIDVKLLDFGIALFKTGARGAHQTVPVGTPQYMSPEQMLTVELDERADLFSVGVCAYYAMTGVFPYPGDTVAEIGCALSRGTFVPASTLRPGLPLEVDAWFDRALSVQVERRFASADEMTLAFSRAVRGSSLPDASASHPSGPAAGNVSLEVVDVADLHDGWPRAVWKATGAMAALACVLVAVHAEVARDVVTVDHAMHTTSATLAAAPASPVVPSAAPPPAMTQTQRAQPAVSLATSAPPAAPPHVRRPRITPRRAHPHAARPIIPGTEGIGAHE